MQTVEYLRAFLFGRLGWSPINALLIISGAFGVFYKERVIAAGGYKSDLVGEDMEMVVRLHNRMREEKRPYKIAFVPDPICWTEVPSDLRSLYNQRVRWQQGLAESLFGNWRLMFRRNGGTVLGGCRRAGSWSNSLSVTAVTSATAASKASMLAAVGRVIPLTLRMY